MSTSKEARDRRGIAAALGLLLGIGGAALIAPKTAHPVLNAIVTLVLAVAFCAGIERLARPKKDVDEAK